MGLLTFKGGVHPYDGKELSADQAIQRLKPGKELVFLMSQHIGAPAVPCVKKGDRVLRGQVIGEAGGFVSAPVHSSVSGKVKAIEKRRNAVGDFVEAIIVENDELYEETDFHPADGELTRDDILARIREAGVVGMGGAGFPTHVKLAPREPEKIDYLLVNGCECEPYLTSDYRCMLEYPEKIVGGLRYMLQLFPGAEGVICIEDNKPEAIRVMTEAIRSETGMRVAVMKTKYPEGAERSLIYAATRRTLNSKMLPADVGCIVDNIDTVIAIYEAVSLGRPLMGRVFTISGDAPAHPRNYEVYVGMSYHEIIEEQGGFKGETEKVISGGPMMGFALFDLNIPVTKTSGALTCFLKDPVPREPISACINCGRCLDACPAWLMPSKLADFAAHTDAERFEEYYGLECVECGSCSFACPAKRPLAAYIRMMRRAVMASKKKK